MTEFAPPRPSTSTRTLSSPPLSPASKPYSATPQRQYQNPHRAVEAPLTPPLSPPQTKSSTNLASVNIRSEGRHSTVNYFPTHDHSEISDSGELQAQISDLPELIECPFDVQVIKDATGKDQLYGRGAWSTVYRATGRERANYTSNSSSSPTLPVPLIVAVKTPARREAKTILRNEGIVLSRITRTEGSERYVVRFHGFLASTESLVLDPVPLSLHDYIGQCANQAHQTISAWPASEPVVGSTRTWLSLVKQMTTALAWLHTEAGGGGIVHGDIKPGNILLARNSSGMSTFAFTPLLADFSSSQLLSSKTISPNTLSAVTREFTAPELLSWKVLGDPNSVATTASDVFSLAVTLLVAATGELMVYQGPTSLRLAMATQGWDVLNNVRNGESGLRVSRHGIVDRVLEKAVLKIASRIDATSWRQLVEKIETAEPENVS